jgi:beta-N-acetylhexosaminidase
VPCFSIENLAARVMCVGFGGAAASEAPLAELASLGPAGVILFARNVVDTISTRALVESVAAALGEGPAPLFAIDQEGGRVARLRQGALEIPAMMALAAGGDLDRARCIGSALARDLRRAGANVALAPVVDLALYPENTVIGARSFGDDPQRVAAFGSALVRGLETGGVAATLKHFPGHGATRDDSHLGLPRIDSSAEALRERDLLPFVAGIAAGARCVLAAHVVVPALDAERPATLSRKILTDLLRDELGFTGVCFTDCLEMDAIARGVGTVRGAVLALAAGADCVLIGHSLELARAARAAIVAAVVNGELPEERLREAASRVDALRTGLRAPLPDTGDRPSADDRELALRVARSAVTLVRGTLLVREGRPVTVVSFEGATTEGVQGRRAEHASLNLPLRERRVRSEQMRVPLDPGGDLVDDLCGVLALLGERDLVIVSRRAHVYSNQRAAIHRLLERTPDALLVSAREPFDVACFPEARNVACIYGDEGISLEGLADVLTGRHPAEGRLPVALAC